MLRLGLLMAAMAGMVGATQPAAAAEPVQVMVLGTYHFASPGRDLNNPTVDDVLKPARQRELQALAVALAEYRPTKIMVERVVGSADLVDENYAAFTADSLASDRNERTQIAYRLARTLGHAQVFGIDEQPGAGEPDYFPYGKLVAWARANDAADRLEAMNRRGAAISKRTEELQSETIPAALADINRPERSAEEHTLYYEMLSFGGTDQQPGADLNAMWYLRNAKIFGKLQQIGTPGDRVLVVYGSGHNYWLRHFASIAPGFRNVDPSPYLAKAAAALTR